MHLGLFTILSLAAGASLHAAVVSSGPQNLSIPADFNGVYLDFTDFNNPGTFSTSTTEPTDWDINFFFGGAAIATSDTFQPVTASAATNAAALGLSSSDVVDGGSSFPAAFSGSTGHIGTGPQQWDNGSTAYLGFRIQPTSFPGGSQPGTTLYGYMEVTLQDDGTVGTIHNWSWETTGVAITIPEPATTGLAALAIIGLAWRRQR